MTDKHHIPAPVVVLLFLFLLVHSPRGFAQSADSLDTSDSSGTVTVPQDTLTADTLNVWQFGEHEHLLHRTYRQRDTSLFLFHEYSKFGRDFPLFSTGNTGHAFYDNNPLSDRDNDYTAFDGAYQQYLTTRENILYYKVRRPFTDLFYVQGSKKEQYFDAFHSQNFSDQFNIAFDFSKIHSQGFYDQMLTNHTYLNLSSNFLSRNKEYGIVAHYFLNNMKVQENGGIADSVEFEANLKPIRRSIFVGLDTANALNEIKDQEFFLKHYYQMGPTETEMIDSVELRTIDPKWRIGHDITYHISKKMYTDEYPAKGFYENVYIDSTLTNDSLSTKRWTNSLFLSNVIETANGMETNLKLYLRHTFYDYYQNGAVDTNYQNYYAGIRSHRLINDIELSGMAEYGVKGYNEGDLLLRGKAVYHMESGDSAAHCNPAKAGVRVKYDAIEPQLFYQHFYSNNFLWNNSFSKQRTLDAKAFYSNDKLGLSAFVQYQSMDNFIYFDKSAMPQQHQGNLTKATAYVNKTFNLWRFHFVTRLQYQGVNDRGILPFPKWLGQQTAYIQFPMFKKALLVQVGGDVFYYDSHFSYAYMPATSVFYLQDSESLGQYPYFNAFINVRLKRARAFLKYQHLNAGYYGYEYYRVPTYPMPDAAFKFGISWRLYN